VQPLRCVAPQGALQLHAHTILRALRRRTLEWCGLAGRAGVFVVEAVGGDKTIRALLTKVGQGPLSSSVQHMFVDKGRAA
jgi:hypothetical protein